ncbi:Hypothetical predicted protein [Paramuricea clavata]|uniref:Uncharacterized protein n=1 Tax=Paramuricea clavata TaxID=317549 RepID=A0A6S7JK47_PARCT|nr:Hypothetical predicted protein [Paramuricea clavata]
MRTVDNVGKLFQPIEDIITEKLIPALTRRSHCSIEERKLLSLPTRYGGVNIVNPVEEASLQLDASGKITEPLKKMIIEQSDSYRKPDLLCEIKAKLRQQKANHHASKAKIIRESLPASKQRTMDLNQEQMKKREYGDRIREIELRLAPLIFSTSGDLGKESNC